MIFQGKKVAEVGCGTGYTAFKVLETGRASFVKAFDFSDEAICRAKDMFISPKLEYLVVSFDDLDEKFDCIIMQEVIEHVDSPFDILLKMKSKLNSNGFIVITCPNFLNIRGIIWMTLQILFNVPMSLSDKNFLNPSDFISFAEKLDMELEWKTFKYEQAHKEEMFIDMKKRLTNALKDAGLKNNNVDKLLSWIRNVTDNESDTRTNGFYKLSLR